MLGLERKSRSQLSKFSGLESFGIHGLEFHFCLLRKTAKKHLVLNGEEFYVRLSHKIKLVQSLASGFGDTPGNKVSFNFFRDISCPRINGESARQKLGLPSQFLNGVFQYHTPQKKETWSLKMDPRDEDLRMS